MEEIWKPIIGYEWFYEISNLWRVKSLNYLRTWKEKLLLNSKSREKLYVSFYLNWIKKTFLVSRLVAIHFIPNPLNLPCVLHKDETLDERWVLYDWSGNLWWWTHKDNSQDMFKKWRSNNIFIYNHPRSMLWKFWKDHNRSKKINQYKLDWTLIKTWDSWMDIYRTIWINNKNISLCCKWIRNKVWWFIWRYT